MSYSLWAGLSQQRRRIRSKARAPVSHTGRAPSKFATHFVFSFFLMLTPLSYSRWADHQQAPEPCPLRGASSPGEAEVAPEGAAPGGSAGGSRGWWSGRPRAGRRSAGRRSAAAAARSPPRPPPPPQRAPQAEAAGQIPLGPEAQGRVPGPAEEAPQRGEHAGEAPGRRPSAGAEQRHHDLPEPHALAVLAVPARVAPEQSRGALPEAAGQLAEQREGRD